MATRQRKSPKKRKASFPRPKPKPKPKRKKPVTTRQSGNGLRKVPRSAKPPKPTTRERKKSSTPKGGRLVRANAERKRGVGKKPTRKNAKPTVATAGKKPGKKTRRQLAAQIERLKKKLAAEKKKRPPKKKPPKKKRPPKKPPAPPPTPAPTTPPPSSPYDIGADVYDYFNRLEKAQAMVEEIICGKGVSAKTLNEKGEEYYLAVAAETDMDPRLIFTMFESPELFGIFC